MENQPNITYAQLITLYEVSRKINSQLHLQNVLDEIMDLAVELLKAEKGLILLKEDESQELKCRVARSMDKRSIQEVVALSRSIIKKVEREGKPVLLQNVPDTGGAPATTSLTRYKIKSVVCVPLRSRAKLMGTIYLDTTQSEHFFKPEDLVFLEGFANLAAIAIENAQSYEEIEKLNAGLEKQVAERTKELRQKHEALQKAYQELKETQLQLIRSEKMASLGQLVAGVAHEINTPLASVTSNTDTFLRNFRKMRDRLKHPDQTLEDVLNTTDVLCNLAQINQVACERMTQIVKTLRNFARLDEEDFKSVDLHEGIDNTLSLIAHLSRGRIEIIKEYGDLPRLQCYAGQLNQVFMNILVNACQAIAGKGKITIKTWYQDEEIHLRFSDTGVGIPPENIHRIFDPGFTTKGVGVGTGLGLSISYKIIEEHGGRIEVESEVGKGSTFTLHLPLQHKRHPAKHSRRS
ncbi:MAG: GAF domain-containing protein [Calditrichaeota bacterium]|nr:MAG: GAF domain-containing protein [Calditrichota bacterium]